LQAGQAEVDAAPVAQRQGHQPQAGHPAFHPLRQGADPAVIDKGSASPAGRKRPFLLL
jgi:hypothetical protein